MRVIDVAGVPRNTTEIATVSNEEFLSACLRDYTIHYVSQKQVVQEQITSGIGPVSQLITILHMAFAEHFPISLSPEILWYTICHETAIHIKEDPAAYARHFTDTPGEKVNLDVRDDSLRYGAVNDWGHTINAFYPLLRDHIPAETLKLFLPSFSTLTVESKTALLVVLMDQASSYYGYRVSTFCGIPAIRLEGEAQDWALLYKQTEALSGMFPRLQAYFADLLPVLYNLRQAAHGQDLPQEFWQSIYKLDGRSGGPFVTGWITAFFAYERTYNNRRLKKHYNWRSLADQWPGGYTLSAFPPHISSVPFTWNYFGQQIPMRFLAGLLGSESRDGFLTPCLGFGVIEKKKGSSAGSAIR